MSLSTWREDLRKPVNALSIGIGIIGLVFAVVTWIIANQVAALSVKIVQIPVFDSKQAISVNTRPDGGSISMPVTVIDGSGKPITTNIYAAEVAVWNSGDFELGQTKVRRPLVITVGGEAKIIDAGISRVTEAADDISAILDSSHTVTVKWQYLDPGNGFRIRVLYASDKQEGLDLSTNILGIHSLTNIDISLNGWKPGVLVFMMMVATILIMEYLKRILVPLQERLVRHHVHMFTRTSVLIFSFAVALLVVMGIWYWGVLQIPRLTQPPI
jgi:hypothetical protein